VGLRAKNPLDMAHNMGRGMRPAVQECCGEYCGRYCTVAKSFNKLLHAGNLVGWEVVHNHDVVALEHRRQAFPSIGPSMTIEATILLCRKAAMNVIVFHAP
jgi:hypothetical protein